MFNPEDITSGMVLVNKRFGYKYKITSITEIQPEGLWADYHCYTTSLNVSHGFFRRADYILATPTTPIDKQAAVIAKTKYLNQRFEQRGTCHV